MARFDKKWLLVHVPAGVAVVALIAFGIVQCNGKDAAEEGMVQASASVAKAEKTLETSVAKMDSLVDASKELLKVNKQQADSIVVLNDSIDTLNGRVVELKNENDSLVVANDSLVIALDNCAKSKQKPIKARQDKPTLTNKPKKAPVYSPKPQKAPKDEKQAVVKPVVLPTVENKADEPKIDISVNHGAKNNGNVVVQNRGGCAGRANAQSVTISLDNNAENNGNIVVGSGNVVSHTTVLPDTVVRFTRAKNTVVKCRVVATQRQYR